MKQDGIDQVVNAPRVGTHIQIIACAGSGKTEALARRVAYLLAHGVLPDSIIAFTFTEKAAAELKQRIVDRSKQDCGESILRSIGRMYVGTIHAYALQLLRTYVPRYANYDLIEEDVLRAWVARHSKQILGTPEWEGLWDRINAFLADADLVENEGIRPSGSDFFSQRYGRFVDLLDSHRLLTFGRSIVKASDEVHRPTVRKQVHKEIRFVFVDEYQDINPSQEHLIHGLVGKQTQLCVVGDDDQSIYQWRGSDVGIMQGFRKRYRPVLTVELAVNKRSVPSIVTVAADFAETIAPRLQKSIGADRMEPNYLGPVRILKPLNREEEAKEIASGIDALIRSGWHPGQIAILIRRWRQAEPILKALEAYDIRYDCGGGSALFTTELGYLLAAGFLIGCDWWVTYGWRQSHLPPPPESASEWVTQFGSLLHLSKKQRSQARAWIKKFSAEAQGEGTRPANLVGDLHDLADAIGVGTWNLENDEEQLRFGIFARFSQVLASFEKARFSGLWIRDGKKSKFRGGQDRGRWFYSALAYFLNGYALEATGGYVAPPDPSSPAVQITTVHSAKGLQWPIVFLPGLEKKKFPSDRIGRIGTTEVPRKIAPKSLLERYAGTEADERRLFYVAMTRARDLLLMSCPERANVRRVSPSKFFEFALDHPKSASPLKGSIGRIPKATQSDSFKAPIPNLSFSNLALYGSCPHAYRLATEFDMARPIARDLGYGKSIHHILRRIADAVKASRKIPSPAAIEALFDSEFHVPFATASGYAEMRRAASKLAFRYVEEWSDDLKSVWEVERPFELHLDSVILAGRADVILDRNGGSHPKLTIVDYKSYDAKKTDQILEHQLRTYTAAGRAEGFDVAGAVLHNLKKNTRDEIAVDPSLVSQTIVRVTSWANGIAARDFPAKPTRKRCGSCDYNHLCQYRAS